MSDSIKLPRYADELHVGDERTAAMLCKAGGLCSVAMLHDVLRRFEREVNRERAALQCGLAEDEWVEMQGRLVFHCAVVYARLAATIAPDVMKPFTSKDVVRMLSVVVSSYKETILDEGGKLLLGDDRVVYMLANWAVLLETFCPEKLEEKATLTIWQARRSIVAMIKFGQPRMEEFKVAKQFYEAVKNGTQGKETSNEKALTNTALYEPNPSIKVRVVNKPVVDTQTGEQLGYDVKVSLTFKAGVNVTSTSRLRMSIQLYEFQQQYREERRIKTMYTQKWGSNKYGAKRTQFNGRAYDSKFEAGVAQELELRKKAGDIVDYDTQFKVEMWAYDQNGDKAMRVTHKVDFRIHHNDGSYELYEAKGFEAPDYRMRRRWLEVFWLPFNPDHTYTVVKQPGR